MSRRQTPNTTPFIPPLNSPSSSPQPAPVIPGSPNWGPSQTSGGGGYPVYPTNQYSPYVNNSPFIPQMSPGTPGVIPPPSFGPAPILAPGGVSQDYTGYPGGNPYTSPMPAQPPQLHTPYNSGYPPPPGVLSPTPYSAPAQYHTFQGTPWPAPAAPLASPWGPPPQTAGPYGAYTPYPPAGNLPGAQFGWGQQQPPPPPPRQPPPQQYYENTGWGGPPPGGNNYPGGGGYPAYPGGGGGFYGQPHRAGPEPPSQAYDRMGPFSEGDSYGPVLDPLLIPLLDVELRINPLIQPARDDGPSNQVYLNWNMLFPTSSVHRSTDPDHVSWSNGRDAPATFPRLSMLRIVSAGFPWVIEVRAGPGNRGVTCGEVIERIGLELSRLSNKVDFGSLPPRERADVTTAYKRNRSRSHGVPGGSLKEGMRRLDFLGINTFFAGLSEDDRIAHHVCGTRLPATLVLRRSVSYPMTEQELRDSEARMRAGSRARSRANSNARISVQPPSSPGASDDDDDDDDPQNDR